VYRSITEPATNINLGNLESVTSRSFETFSAPGTPNHGFAEFLIDFLMTL
jgi:hypothetical protein